MLKLCPLWKKHKTDGIALLCACLGEWWLLSLAACIGDEYKPHSYASYVNQTIFNICYCGGPISVIGHFGIFIDRHHESVFGAVTAGATIAIAWFTATLWRTTTEQARLTRDSIELGNKEFIATHRPKIRVRYVKASTPSYNWKPTAKIYASNIGPSEASLIRNGVDIFLRQKGHAESGTFDATPKEITPPLILPAGKDAAMDATGHTGALTSQNVADIINGVFELCLLGVVSYTDGNAVERTTSYFRVWDVKRKRFVRAPEDDEYAEWDYED